MRCIKNKIEHNGSGTVTLCPDEPEDMVRWPQQPTLNLQSVLTCLDQSSGMPST